jgi:diguanylate cyclase (GGDEF)-like protein
LQRQLGDRSLTDVLSHRLSDVDSDANYALADRVWRYDRSILEVINQLNQAIALIDQPAERIELAALNLVAGRRALAATAYQTALSSAKTGIDLLSFRAWSAHYDLNLALHELAAEAAYLCGEFAQTARSVATVQRWSRSLLDTILVCDIQIKAYIAAGQPQAAVQFGLKTLRQLGLRLPTQPSKLQAGLTLLQTQLWLRWHSPRQLCQLPNMTDPWAIAVAQILQPLAYIAVMAQPHLMPTYILTSLQLARKFGNSVNLAYAYASYGMLRSSVVGDFNGGCQFSQLALDALDQSQDKAAAPRIQVALAMVINHWQMPFRQVAAAMPPVYQACLATGQLEIAAWALHTHSYNQYFAGCNLATMAQQLEEYAETVRQFNQLAVLRFIQCTRYFVALFQGNATTLTNAAGELYDLDQCLAQAAAVNNRTEVFVYYVARSLKQTIAGEPALAYADLQTAYPYLNTVGSLPHLPMFHYQMALGAAAYADIVVSRPQRAIRRTMKRSVNYLQTAARQCPANYGSKFYLAQAEWYRITGDRVAAIVAYDRAITLAQENQMQSDLAQANELAGRFYLQCQQPMIAQVYLTQAYHAYQDWGAIAKVDDLLQTYPDLLASCCPPPAVAVEIAPNPILPSPEALSLKNAMQAALAISSEIELTPLLETLMRTVLQESGADRGVLLLCQSDRRQSERHQVDRRQSDRAPSRQWQIYIDTTDMQAPLVLDPPIALCLEAEGSRWLPNTLLQYVGHTQEPLIINASDFDSDRMVFDQQFLPLLTFQLADYFQYCQPQSLLGLPIVRQQQLVGILYLENQQLEGVFSHDRVELLQLLCAQAAIAIANAQLYQRNRDYTQRLEQTQMQMLQLQSDLLDETLHDPLTGLFNRNWFANRITWLLQYNRLHPPRFYAVLLLDLDRFKVVNDSLGHLVGDQLLQAVAIRLQSCLADPAPISRLGGDEFVILLEDVAELDDVIALAESILAQFSLAFTIAGYEIYSNASIGIATSDTAYYNPEDVLRDADTALYAAKARNKGSYIVFNQALERSAKERLHLENDLRQAIADSQSDSALAPLYLQYQPIYDLQSRAIAGVEALVRWDHPIVGAISPLKFIPIAEETGLINTLGPWILASACAQLAQWQQQGNLPEGFTLHVNCSALQFHQVGWLEQIETILQQTQIQPAQLKLEITENCLLNLVDVQPGAIAALRDLGIRLCIDDFGVGYSSLSRLLTLPIDTIKIDRSFVEDFMENADRRAMVQMILTLAQTLKMAVVAEGIQTLAAIEYLQSHGCQLGQSFFLSRPVAADRIAALF